MPRPTRPLDESVALITGAASGIGSAVARRLAGAGARVVLADVDERGADLATELDGVFVRCDVRSPDDNDEAVAAAVDRFGGLDIVHLNAGIASQGHTIGDAFDIDAYRRVVNVNLDGVVLGTNAALGALRARGGGVIVATASMAGLVPVAIDPIYAATKHAVVGFIRSIGPALAADDIDARALCPWFADTPILGDTRVVLEGAGIPVLTVDDVVEAFMALLDGESTGDVWPVLPGTATRPHVFVPPAGMPTIA